MTIVVRAEIHFETLPDDVQLHLRTALALARVPGQLRELCAECPDCGDDSLQVEDLQPCPACGTLLCDHCTRPTNGYCEDCA